MIYLALSLGFFGSMHCIGMCGPLALGVSKLAYSNQRNYFISSFKYNIGRVVTYTLLGLVFGLVGQTLIMSGFQRIFSILAGLVLIVLFLFSLDFEQFLRKSKFLNRGLSKISVLISETTSSRWMKMPFAFGLANGLLPCGLVYLALAGSLTYGGVEEGMLFMFLFGISTIPALFILAIGGNFLSGKFRISLRKLLPFIQLIMGAYLIYRGIAVGIPDELDFYTALKNPILCH